MKAIFHRGFKLAFIGTLFLLLLQRSTPDTSDPVERVRRYTRGIEFNYVNWTLDAMGLKLGQVSLGAADYLDDTTQSKTVLEFLDVVSDIQHNETLLKEYYSNPDVTDPDAESQLLRRDLDALYRKRARLAPLAEAILQNQISAVVAEEGLTLGGQPIPPLLFHMTPLPVDLIVSPRNVIRQDANISLKPDLPLDKIVALEEQVDNGLDVSSLVVPVGGIGLYPTMVMQTTSINWLVEVVSHEWTHNFLDYHPLGMSYENSPELRTMNETTASISGKELGALVIKRFYPEFVLPPPQPKKETAAEAEKPAEPPAFDFRAEMHETRVTVDELLAAGKIEEAETYMEMRRKMFWDHGYRIRKLNQAYFAFYGAYADQPGGAAGEDPVGAAVRALRAQSGSLADFINRMAWMWSFDQLKAAVER